MTVPVQGSCDPAFVGVREAFVQNFADRGEVGAAVCVMVDGRVVVDLQGGWVDEDRTRLWGPDTLVDVYSVGKPVIALLLLQLVDAGAVGLDDPVASVWAEFGAAGKDEATVRQALCHRAGVPAIREPLTNDDLWDWGRMCSSLAATEPWWEPGTRHAYHTNTYGHLIGEQVRRAGGESPGSCLRSVMGPIDPDLFFGVPLSEQHRCADIIWGGPTVEMTHADLMAMEGDDRMTFLGYFNPSGYSSMGVVNTEAWRSALVPSTNGHGTARAVARLYGALLEPGRLVSSDLLSEATSAQSTGFCPTLGEEAVFGLGFAPSAEHRRFGPNDASFGHFGTGGSLGFADPTARVAFGYVMNQVIPRWKSTRNQALLNAVYDSL